jgi:RNase H-like domain found in reverse transcriptase
MPTRCREELWNHRLGRSSRFWAVKKLRPYLEGLHFTICTDHSALKWLLSARDHTGCLARWALVLSTFDFTI